MSRSLSVYQFINSDSYEYVISDQSTLGVGMNQNLIDSKKPVGPITDKLTLNRVQIFHVQLIHYLIF